MAHQPTNRTPAPPPPPRWPELGPTSALEVHLESQLVARCGVDAMLRRHDDRDTPLVDWLMINLDDRPSSTAGADR